MKKIIALTLALLLSLSFAGCTAGNDGTYTIGICQIEPHPALDAASQGFQDALIAEFGAEKLNFINQNAAGDSNTLNAIINDYVSRNVDLILANSTPVLQTAAAATTTIPILGTSVTEYGVALEIDNFAGLVGKNISGTSDLAPLDQQAKMLLEWFPDAKNVGLLFCLAEPNSKYQVDEVQKYLQSSGITVKQFGFSSSADLAAVAQEAADWSDVIYVPTDNTVANATGIVDGICRAAKVPIIAGEEGICSGCGVATLCISYYDLGYTTGQMAAKILKGEANISEMKIQYAPEPTAKYNPDLCEYYELTPPEGYVPIGE